MAHDADEAHVVIDHGILVDGLRALTAREVVVLLAVDRLDWDQRALAVRLGLGNELLRVTLFEARTVFYTLVRHTAGIDVDDEERGRLTAYLAGELTGPRKRLVRRHLQHCRTCQALCRGVRAQ